MTKQPPSYKDEQLKYRMMVKANKSRPILFSDRKLTANLGIAKFKREHRGDSFLIRTFKDNAWKSGQK